MARAFLLDDAEGADTAEVLARSLSEHDVARSALRGVRRLSGSALRIVDCEIATVAAGLLDIDLGDALVSAWRKYSAMTEAAERTLAVPGSEEVVVLTSHRVACTYQPQVELLVDGKKITTFEFDMTVVLDLDGVVAVVRLGELVALRCGDCTITATLKLKEATLAQKQGHRDLGLVVPLESPLPLLSDGTITKVQLRQLNASTL
jgi:hypothetical protein